MQSHDKYLGLPTIFNRSKKISFRGVRDRIWKKLQEWKERLLFRAGKEILIKSIIHSIPSYAMSCFRLPTCFFKEVESITRSFWWGSHTSRGIPWKAWKFLCKPKEESGMGFRDLEKFNSALLAKQLSHLHTYPTYLLASTFKSKYFSDSNIWDPPLGELDMFLKRGLAGELVVEVQFIFGVILGWGVRARGRSLPL